MAVVICFELMNFPEPARIMALSGADIIFQPTLGQYFDGKPETLKTAIVARTRAIENRVYVCPAMYGTRGSGIISPEGNVVAEAFGKTDVVVTAELDLAKEVRESSIWWNTINGTDLIRARNSLQRRPETYGILLQKRPPLMERYPDVRLISRDEPERIRKAIDTINYSPAARRRRAGERLKD